MQAMAYKMLQFKLFRVQFFIKLENKPMCRISVTRCITALYKLWQDVDAFQNVWAFVRDVRS